MVRLILSRLLIAIPVLFVVTLATFGLTYLVPGDPAVTLAGPDSSPEQVDQLRTSLGLDQPIVTQYGDWIGGVLEGDMGDSLLRNRPVSELITERIPVSLSLTMFAVVIALLVAVPAGILAGAHQGRPVDRAITVLTSTGVSLPSYFVGLLLVITFSLTLAWFPASGYVTFSTSPLEWAKHLLLPGFALGLAMSAEITRQLRGAVADVLDRDYIRTARAKGMRRQTILFKHTLRNASAAPLTVLGLQVAHLLGGAVVIEQVFAIPGLGTLAVDAVMQRDLPVVQGVVLVAVVIVTVTNIAVDVSYGIINPRSRPT